MYRSEELQALIDHQHGVISGAQLRSVGYPRDRLRHRLETRRWQAVLRGVYATSSGPLTREMTLSAALLYGGGHSVLSHRTAAEEWGWLPVEAGLPVHVTVPYGKSALCQSPRVRRPAPPAHPGRGPGPLHPGVIVHRSRAHPYIGIDFAHPRTTKADTAIDLAVSEPNARAAYVRLIMTVTNARIRLADVVSRLVERPPRRYRRALASAVTLLADGVQSALEFHYAVDVERAHGLPGGDRQGPVIVDGRTLWEDVDYTVHGVPLIVRLDGRWAHSMREIQFRDRRRDNAAELADRPRLIYGMEEVGRTACLVAREVERVLAREGWVRGTDNPCLRCAREH
ncbi:hypothetical protein [Rhodococcus sp. NPDC003348]